MSHTTRRKSAIKDPEILKKACTRIPGAQYLGIGRGKGSVGGKSGHQVQLPDWHYPVTVDCTTGECTFDNYGGRWGKESELDKLKQGYGVEAAKAKATADGHTEMEELTLDDGSIKVIIPLGGGGYEVDEGGGGGDGWGV
jgi:hypothetical protein